MRGVLSVLLLAFLGAAAPDDQLSRLEGKTGPPPLAEEDAEHLFLDYINSPQSLIRSCMFLGGVRVEEMSPKGEFTTVQIRYRIQCTQEEIETPPLTRTLHEDFVYRYTAGHWGIVGRASELPPALKGEGKPPATESQPALGPVDRDRKAIVEQILAWAVLGRRPAGVKEAFPEGQSLAAGSQVLVSSENLGGVVSLALPGREVVILAPAALLQRTALDKGRAWVRFDLLEIQSNLAHARVSLVVPVLLPPSPGEAATRALSSVEADFVRRARSWVLTRHHAVR